MAQGHWRKLLLFILPFILPLVTGKTGPLHGKVVVCYIATWAVYRPGPGAYSIDDFDGNLCTHAVYAFAGLDITQAAIKSLDPWQDLKEEYGKGGYERLTSIKRRHPHLKVLLAIGGWNEGSKNYSILVANTELRHRFVKQVTVFVRKYNFDGLDLDWEYPTQRGGSLQDRENFVKLTKELRAEFDPHNLLLTSAIGASKNVIDKAYDVRQISRFLDYLHIMCYDYHGSWDNRIGYNAPLTSSNDDPFSVEFTIDYLLGLGAPKEKVVLGLPFYGRTFDTPFNGQLDDRSEGIAMQGPYTREQGFLGYNEICSILTNKSSEWKTSWDGNTAQMIARSPRDPNTGNMHVVTYDDVRSIANKARYAVMKDLAGVMIWSVDTDDFSGKCDLETYPFTDFVSIGSNVKLFKHLYSNYPLLRTLNEAIELAQEEYQYQYHDEDNTVDGNEILLKNSSNRAELSIFCITIALVSLFSCFTSKTFAAILCL